MPTARQLAKRQKRAAVEQFDGACATFDALSDAEYPLTLVAENLLRALSYEGVRGVGELAALLVQSAGCTAPFEIADGEWADAARAMESACLLLPEGCPAEFPCQKPVYLRRFAELLATVANALVQTGNAPVLRSCAALIAEFAQLRLQSLRYVATAAACALVNAYTPEQLSQYSSQASSASIDGANGAESDGSDARAEDESDANESDEHDSDESPSDDSDSMDVDVHSASPELVSEQSIASPDTDFAAYIDTLHECVLERRFDCAPAVRRMCAPAVVKIDPSAALVWLNDTHAPVRAACLRALCAAPAAALSEPQLVRLAQSAKLDVDVGVRRAALRALLKLNGSADAMLLCDADATTRNLCAELFAKRELARHKPARALLACADAAREVRASPTCHSRAAAAIARAFDRTKPGAAELCQGLLLPRRGRAPARAQFRYLLEIMGAAAQVSVPALRLLDAVRHDDEQLVCVLRLLAHGTPDQSALDAARELFMDREAPAVLDACRAVFTAAVPARAEWVAQIYHDVRVRAAALLGPTGAGFEDHRSQVDAYFAKVVYLAPLVDVSDILRLPVWTCLAADADDVDPYALQVVRAVGLTADADSVKQVLEHLESHALPECVTAVVEIHVAAKMRGIEVGPLAPEFSAPPDNRAYVAAVAARVI